MRAINIYTTTLGGHSFHGLFFKMGSGDMAPFLSGSATVMKSVLVLILSPLQ